MERERITRVLMIALALVLLAGVLGAVGCTKNADTPPVTDNGGSGVTTPAVVATTTAPPELVDPADPASDDGSAKTSATTTPATLEVTLYWVSTGENALGVKRTIPYTKAVATATMQELIAGPTAAELKTWPALSSAIPGGTKLLGISVANGVARVDLSKEFESGGGTFSVTARLAQVVYTLEQFPTVDAVEFYIEGRRVEVFSGEGIMLDGPQRLDDFDELLPIDA